MASLAKKEEECFPLGELPDTCLYEVSSHLPLSDLLSLRMVCRRVSSWAERVLSSRRMPNQEQQSSRSLLRRLSSDFSPGAADAAVSVSRLSLHPRPGAVETMPRGPHSPADPSFHPLRPVEGSGDLVFDRERVLYVDGGAKKMYPICLLDMLCLEEVFVLGGTLYLWIGTSWECCFVGVTSFLTRMPRRFLPSEDRLEAERFSEESLLIPDVVQRKCFGGDKLVVLSYGFDLPLHGTLAPQDPNLMLQYMQLCSATDDPAIRVGDVYNLWLEEPGFLNLELRFQWLACFDKLYINRKVNCMEKYHHGDVDKDELKRMKEKYRRGELSQDEMLDVLKASRHECLSDRNLRGDEKSARCCFKERDLRMTIVGKDGKTQTSYTAFTYQQVHLFQKHHWHAEILSPSCVAIVHKKLLTFHWCHLEREGDKEAKTHSGLLKLPPQAPVKADILEVTLGLAGEGTVLTSAILYREKEDEGAFGLTVNRFDLATGAVLGREGVDLPGQRFTSESLAWETPRAVGESYRLGESGRICMVQLLPHHWLESWVAMLTLVHPTEVASSFSASFSLPLSCCLQLKLHSFRFAGEGEDLVVMGVKTYEPRSPTIRYYISVPSLTLLVVDRTTGDMKCKLEKLMHGNKRVLRLRKDMAYELREWE